MKTQIKNRLMNSIKARNGEADILRVVLGEIQLGEARKNRDLTVDEISSIIYKLIESNLEVNTTKTKIENSILEELVPKKLGSEQIRDLLYGKPEIFDAPSDGVAVGLSMKLLKNQGHAVDGRLVSEVVQEIRRKGAVA
jgi:uncharacterized protein YqeY